MEDLHSKYSVQLIASPDLKSFFELLKRNRIRLEDYFPRTMQKTKTESNAFKYGAEILNKIESRTYLPYLIVEKEFNSPIGMIDLKNIDWRVPKAELGVFIDESQEGKGIMYFFTNWFLKNIVPKYGFVKIFCRVSPENTRCIKLIERNEFEYEGYVKNDLRTSGGELIDLKYYGKTFNQ